MDFKELVNTEAYDFLRTEEDLGEHIMYLTLSGSIGYGTNKESSDIDLRGVTMESSKHLFGLESFEQFEDMETDTVIYGLKKFVTLASKGNPNIIELLGTNDEHILYMSESGKVLRDNANLFLSKKIIRTFGNYATAQLRRLQNALARDQYTAEEKERHILNTLNNQMAHFRANYSDFDLHNIKLYEGTSEKSDMKGEILMDIHLEGYPLRDFASIYSEMSNVVRDYGKLNHRNRKKSDEKLYKHAMHLIRLLIMGTEILETGEIVTYRSREHDFLMAIRNGHYNFENIVEMANEWECTFLEAATKTELPDDVDYGKIERLLIDLYTTSLSKGLTGKAT